MIIFRVRDIGAQMYRIEDVYTGGKPEDVDTYSLYEAKTVQEMAQWGIRKNAEVLQADVVENFRSLYFQETEEERNKRWAEEKARESYARQLRDEWEERVYMDDWEWE